MSNGLPVFESAKFEVRLVKDRGWNVGDVVPSPIADDFGKRVEFAGVGRVHKLRIRRGRYLLITAIIKHEWARWVDERGATVAIDGRSLEQMNALGGGK